MALTYMIAQDPPDCKAGCIDEEAAPQEGYKTCPWSYSKEAEEFELKQTPISIFQVSLKLNLKRDNQRLRKDGNRTVNSLNSNLYMSYI